MFPPPVFFVQAFKPSPHRLACVAQQALIEKHGVEGLAKIRADAAARKEEERKAMLKKKQDEATVVKLQQQLRQVNACEGTNCRC